MMEDDNWIADHQFLCRGGHFVEDGGIWCC